MPALLAWLARIIPYVFTVVLPAVWKKFMGLRFPVRMAIIVALLAAMPVPAWISDLPGLLGSLPASVGYFAGLVKLRFGVTVVFGAYLTRFVWREISKSV